MSTRHLFDQRNPARGGTILTSMEHKAVHADWLIFGNADAINKTLFVAKSA